MRHLGHIPHEQPAKVFSDLLVSRGIRNEVEHDAGSWSIWVIDEEQLGAAQELLARFNANPEAAEFQSAAAEAEKVRAAEKEDLEKYRRRIRTRRTLFPKFGGYGVGVLTYALIVICVMVAFYSKFGQNAIQDARLGEGLLRHLYIREPLAMFEGREGFLPEVAQGEVWRLITPIFIHFGPIHLLFNMMWLYQLGCMIEARQGTLRLALVIAASAILSNVAEFMVPPIHPFFGGMSGVVYALAGYVWMRGKYDRSSGLYLDQQSVMILLFWLVVCYTGLVGNIANTAHLVGLIVGVALGLITALFASRRPEADR